MILSRELSNALNDQVTAQMWSSNLYMSMAAHFMMLGHKGMASWMKKKSFQELESAYQLIEYSLANGGQIVIGVINAVPTGFGTPQEIFERAVDHEQHQIKLMQKVMNMAADEKDSATEGFMSEYINGQEEQTSAKAIVEKFKQNGDQSLDVLDQELGK
ncbi:MAG: ferritin [Tannerellaceae bacterium]|nr:ferritin [Tannerellaceae bacterium]